MMADGSANPAGHSSSSQCTESEDSRGEIERQLHEDVLLYLQEQRYRQECTKNEKRCIRRKAMRYTLEDGALLYTEQDKTKVKIYYYNASCMHRTEVEKPALGGRGIDSPSRAYFL